MWYVDIPPAEGTCCSDWKNVGTFGTEQEAIKFAMEQYGADDEGKVCLITGDNEWEEV